MRKAITDIAMIEAGLSDYDPPLDAYRKGRADMLAEIHESTESWGRVWRDTLDKDATAAKVLCGLLSRLRSLKP